MLPTRRLGLRGPAVSLIGLGCWAIGGGGPFGWGPQDDEDSLRTMHEALEAGINWFDTAPFYGHGHSEEVIGRFLGEVRGPERPFVLTKCGLVWDETDLSRPSRRDLSPRSIRRECEASLGRLGVEYIDLLQFHWPDQTGLRIEESWAEAQQLIAEGKVRWAGVSNFGIDLLDACEAVGHVDSVQLPFSLVNREAAPELLTWARGHGSGLICYSPMASGLLTDDFTLEYWSALPTEDWRRSSDWFAEAELRRGLAVRDALRPIAQAHETTVSAVAVAWVLAWHGVTGAIAGARHPDQIRGWIDAAALQLTEPELDAIAEAVIAAGLGRGPERPQR